MAFEFTYQAFDMEQYDPSTQNLNNMRDSELKAYLENPTAITSTLTTSLTVEDESVTQNYSVLSRGNLYLATNHSGNYYASLSPDNLLFRYFNARFQIEPNTNSTPGLISILKGANVTGSNKTLTLPNATGLLISTGDTGTVTNTMLAGSITNAKLANSTISGISLGSNLATLTIGTGLSGTSYNGSTATTIDLANTTVTAASYTNASITVDAQGRLTAASSGTSPVTTVTGTSPIVSSGGATPAISLAANYGDTLNPYAAKTAAFVLAGPTTGAAAVPAFRAIVATDIPTLNQNTTGTASNITASSNTTLTSLANLTTVGTLTALRVDGNFGVGVNGLAQMGLRISKAISGSAFAQGIYLDGAIQPSVTSRADMIWTAGSVAASVTVPTVNQFYATLAGVGAGSTVTTSSGFVAESNLGNPYSGTITNAYGFVGNLASGTNRYNLFMNGSAPNFLNGRLGVGVALTSGAMAQITNPNASASDKVLVVKGAVTQAGDFFDVQDSSGTSQFKVDSTVNLLLGATSRRSVGGAFQTAVTNQIFNEQGSGGLTAFTSVLNRADSNGLRFVLGKSRGTAAGAVTALVANDSIAEFHFAGADGTTLDPLAARIMVHVDGVVATGSVPGRLSFSTNPLAGTSPVERMRIDSAGFVGIGTSAPTVRLEVAGSTTISSQNNVAATFGTTTSGRLLVGSITGNTPFVGSEGVTNLLFTTNAVERMRIDSAGLVGIGTGTPTSKLHVVGSFSRGAPVTKTANFTLADTENWITCNGTATITVTLPAASTQVGREITIKTVAAFTVVSASANVNPQAGGAAGTAILPATAGAWATLVSNGTNWVIMQS